MVLRILYVKCVSLINSMSMQFCFRKIVSSSLWFVQKRYPYGYWLLTPMAQQPRIGQSLLVIEGSRSHHTRYESSVRVISLSQRPLSDSAQHSQEADIYSNPQLQQVSGRSPTPQTVRPQRQARIFLYDADFPNYYMQYSDYYKNKTTILVVLMVGH